jgi:hypothetical protein
MSAILHQNKVRDDKVFQANRFMVSKLMELLENDKIWNEYDRGFIERINNMILTEQPLSENQQEHLDLIFHHRY